MAATETQTKPVTYTIAETAKLLRKGINQTYEAVHQGEIPSIKIGSRYYVPVAAFERMLAEAGQRGGEVA